MQIVKESKLETDVKAILRNDISNSSITYEHKAWKACAAMIGSILEGVMLGTLLRQDVLDFVVKNQASVVLGREKNLYDPHIKDHRERILSSKNNKNLSYDLLKQFIIEIIPQRKDFDPTTIQEFRNIIHPAVALKDKKIKN